MTDEIEETSPVHTPETSPVSSELQKSTIRHLTGEYSKKAPDHDNQDIHKVKKVGDRVLYALVADGMGGHADGAKASRLAGETVSSDLEKTAFPPQSVAEAQNLIKDAINHAQEVIGTQNQDKKDSQRMGTTLSLCYIHQDSGTGQETAVIGNIGDSRVYLERAGKLIQLTQDHDPITDICETAIKADESLLDLPQKLKDPVYIKPLNQALNRLLDTLPRKYDSQGLDYLDLKGNESSAFTITDTDGQSHPLEISNYALILLFRSRFGITDYLGQKGAPQTKLYTQPLQSGDRLLIVSDGITDNLTEDQILRFLTDQSLSPDTKSKMLVALSTMHPKKPDDTTAVVIEIQTQTELTPKPLDVGDKALTTTGQEVTILGFTTETNPDGTQVQYARIAHLPQTQTQDGTISFKTEKISIDLLKRPPQA